MGRTGQCDSKNSPQNRLRPRPPKSDPKIDFDPFLKDPPVSPIIKGKRMWVAGRSCHVGGCGVGGARRQRGPATATGRAVAGSGRQLGKGPPFPPGPRNFELFFPVFSRGFSRLFPWLFPRFRNPLGPRGPAFFPPGQPGGAFLGAFKSRL